MHAETLAQIFRGSKYKDIQIYVGCCCFQSQRQEVEVTVLSDTLVRLTKLNGSREQGYYICTDKITNVYVSQGDRDERDNDIFID